MVSDKTQLVEALSSVAPVYYELFLDSTCAVPCISYIEMSNVDDRVGEFLRYSWVSYTVKVWSHSVEELTDLGAKVDKSLRPLGYRRTGSFETSINGLLCKVMTFRGLGKEYITED